MNTEEQVNVQEAREMLANISAVNLDEVSPETLTVAFRDYLPDAKHGYKVQVEHKEIETFVPMFLFNRMLANQKKVQKLHRQHRLVQADESAEAAYDLLAEDSLDFAQITDEMFKEIVSGSDPSIVWQAKEVLSIWKLTPGEEGMSLKRLMLGLSFDQIVGLFSRFFGAMLLQKMK